MALSNADCSYRAQKCSYAQRTGQWYEKLWNSPMSLLRWHANLLHLVQETSPFVLVLVDGNAHTVRCSWSNDCGGHNISAQFHDNFFRHGALGGADAAIKLREAIEQQVVCSQNPDWKIVVRIYIDFQALVDDFAKLQSPISGTRLRKFVGGFTQVQPLCDIIDTGPGREEALVKIKGRFQSIPRHVRARAAHTICVNRTMWHIP